MRSQERGDLCKTFTRLFRCSLPQKQHEHKKSMILWLTVCFIGHNRLFVRVVILFHFVNNSDFGKFKYQLCSNTVFENVALQILLIVL